MADPAHDPAPVTDFFRAIGRGEAGEGRSLDAMQTAMRVGGMVAWRRMTEGAEVLEVSPRTLGAVGEVLMEFQDDLAHAAAEGFSQAKAAVAGEMQRRRKRLLDLLFADPPTAQEAIADLAAAAHWPIPRTIAAVALGLHHQDSRSPRSRRTCSPTSPVAPQPDHPRPGRPRPREARRPCPVRDARRRRPDRPADGGGTVHPVGAQDAVPRPARRDRGGQRRDPQRGAHVHADPVPGRGLITSLADLRLAPLAHLRPSQQDRLAETLLAWLQSGRNANEVAMRLHVHPQTVRYRLRQLEELFGDQLLDPDLRFDLEIVLRARALLADNAGERIIPPSREAVGDSGEVVSIRRT